jgi:hypothetical protein
MPFCHTGILPHYHSAQLSFCTITILLNAICLNVILPDFHFSSLSECLNGILLNALRLKIDFSLNAVLLNVIPMNVVAPFSACFRYPVSMDKPQLTEQNLGRVFNSRSDWMFVMHLFSYEAKQPNLKLKTRPKQLLGYLPLAFALPAVSYWSHQWWTLSHCDNGPVLIPIMEFVQVSIFLTGFLSLSQRLQQINPG